jgi:FtsP/CotA-like multicopper oxidase with cupredoxin domain
VHLFVDRRARVFGDLPGFGFVVQAGSQIPARDSIRIPGSPLLLERGKPVAVVVHNRLTTPAAIHWHGIELESYYDGVGGWSGLDAHIAPMIPPDSTFVARFTPPRAGTYIYHIHSESGDELASGLYGPLIVLDPDKPFDERYDHVFVIAADGPKPDHAVAVNGSRAPDTLRLVAGETHRVRLIDISANDVHLTTLRGPDGPVSWRLLAHDGWDVSSAEREPRVARTVTSAGTTQDYEIALAVPGDYTLVVAQAITAGATPTGRVTTVAIRVGASEGRGKGEEGRGRKSGSPRDALRRGR